MKIKADLTHSRLVLQLPLPPHPTFPSLTPPPPIRFAKLKLGVSEELNGQLQPRYEQMLGGIEENIKVRFPLLYPLSFKPRFSPFLSPSVSFSLSFSISLTHFLTLYEYQKPTTNFIHRLKTVITVNPLSGFPLQQEFDVICEELNVQGALRPLDDVVAARTRKYGREQEINEHF